MAFISVLSNVGMMLLYMSFAFAFTKIKMAKADHAKTLSTFLVYLCSPCMILSAFQEMPYSLPMFGKVMLFFGVSFLVQLFFFLLLWAVFNRKLKDSKYRIMATGAVLGNAGFFGIPILTGMYPNEPVVASYCTLFITGMNILVFTIGVFMITKKKQYISIQAAIMNPTVLSAVIAIMLYLFQFHFPTVIGNSISLLGKMCTPLCMFVLGMRLATMNLKTVFGKPFPYVTSLLKLIVFPAFTYLCVAFLPFFSPLDKVSIAIMSATPSAAVILSMAEFHECEQEKSANVILVSSIMSIVTIPLLVLVLDV